MSMNTILTLGIVAGVGYFLYTGDLQKWLDGLSGQVNQMLQSAKPQTSAAPEGGEGGLPFPQLPAPAPGGGGGPISPGGSCPGGASCKFDGSDRWECDGINWPAYEATWCGTVNGSDNLSIKMWGPNHSDANCCWCILNVDQQSGAFSVGGEGPHPDTAYGYAKGGSMGPLKNACVKAVIRPGGGGAIVEGYGLVGGQWKKMVEYTGPCGENKKSNSPASGQQVSFRFDVSGVDTKCATVHPLGAGGTPPAASGALMVLDGGPGVHTTYSEGIRFKDYRDYDQGGRQHVAPAMATEHEFIPHIASEDERYTSNRMPTDYMIGATEVIQAGQFQYRREIPSKSPKPTPAQRSQSSGGGVGGPSSKQKYDKAVREQAARNRALTLSQQLARMSPAQRDRITQTWIVWARARALARARQILAARQRSGYRPVGYGGFGGTEPGALGSSIQQALQLSGIGTGKGRAASGTNEYTMASDHLKRYAACNGNKECGLAEIRNYDNRLTTTLNQTLSKYGGSRYDPLSKTTMV